MTKQEFLAQLQKALSGLSREDIAERLNFYSEMIDDYVEEGLTEGEAVSRIGSVDEIAAQILGDIPPSRSKTEKPPKKLDAAAIVLIILGSPIWLSLLIAALAVIFSLFVSLWSIIVSFWSVFASLAASALGILLGGVILIATGSAAAGIALLGISLVCAGLAIFTFIGCRAATKGAVRLTAIAFRAIKNCFQKKEAVNNA